MRVIIKENKDIMANWAANYVAYKINKFRPTKNKPFVLGLPTGSTPLGMYQELFEMGTRTVRNAMENYTKKAGLPHIRVHDLRHSHASMLINMGISPKLIQERLGHKSISTTLDVYSHFYKDRQADIIDALQDVNKTYNLQKAVSNEYQDKK